MNEPTNFCPYPCLNPEADSSLDAGGLNKRHVPSERSTPKSRLDHETKNARNTPSKKIRKADSSLQNERREVGKRQYGGDKKGLPGRDLIHPLYRIDNVAGILSNLTADTDLIHQGGWAEYDTHNL